MICIISDSKINLTDKYISIKRPIEDYKLEQTSKILLEKYWKGYKLINAAKFFIRIR